VFSVAAHELLEQLTCYRFSTTLHEELKLNDPSVSSCYMDPLPYPVTQFCESVLSTLWALARLYLLVVNIDSHTMVSDSQVFIIDFAAFRRLWWYTFGDMGLHSNRCGDKVLLTRTKVAKSPSWLFIGYHLILRHFLVTPSLVAVVKFGRRSCTILSCTSDCNSEQVRNVQHMAESLWELRVWC